MIVLLITTFLVIFSFSVFGRNLVSIIPIIITAKGCTPWVVKDIKATEAIVPAKVDNTPPNEFNSSLIRFNPITFGPLVFNIFLKDLR